MQKNRLNETAPKHAFKFLSKIPIPLGGDSATIRNFGQNDTNRNRSGKSAKGRSRSVSEFQFLYKQDTKAQRKRSSIAKVVARSQLHRHQRRLSVAKSSLSKWDRSRSVTKA